MAGRNAFGTYLVSPDKLSLAEKVELLVQAEHTLASGYLDAYTSDWWRGAIHQVLTTGCTMHEAMGLSQAHDNRTPQRIVQQRHRDSLLLQLATAVGSQAKALRVLRGVVPCPPQARPIVDELQGIVNTMPGRSAFTRARKRLASPHRA